MLSAASSQLPRRAIPLRDVFQRAGLLCAGVDACDSWGSPGHIGITPTPSRSTPCRALLAALRKAGFTGPFGGGQYGIMVRGQQRLAVPNPHSDQEIGRPLLGELLRQAGITRDEWDALQPASAKAPVVGRYHQPPATAHAGTARPSWGVPAIMGCPGPWGVPGVRHTEARQACWGNSSPRRMSRRHGRRVPPLAPGLLGARVE